MNDTLQLIIEAHVYTTQLEWQVQDAAERPWNVEYIYIFLGAMLIFLGICTVGQLRMFLAIEGLNEIAKQFK